MVIGILILVIVVLLVIVVYALVVRPAITSYVVNVQTKGYNQALIEVAQEAATCQQPIPLRIGNQTVNIVALQCFQQTPLQ